MRPTRSLSGEMRPTRSLSRKLEMDTALLEKQAIELALNQSWEKAVEINRELLCIQPNNVTALNRLGRAYLELGKIAKARQTYKKVLKIDCYNPIAGKNIARLLDQKLLTKKPGQAGKSRLKEVFLEEPGKTKVVKLVRLASTQILSQLDSGDPVSFLPKKRIISVLDQDNTYLGALPDDLSQRLVNLMNGGNRYQAFVKCSHRQHLEIFIREIFRSKKFHHTPSFPISSTIYPPLEDDTPIS